MASLWPAGRAELRTGWSFRDLYAPLVGAPVGRDEISSAGYREAWGEAGMLSSRSGRPTRSGPGRQAIVTLSLRSPHANFSRLGLV